jgi:bifunctional NMN adenylyltransferase/nudix hydrolase
MKNEGTLGVVVGRFQLHELHAGHIGLLDFVNDRSDKMLILVGHSSVRYTPDNPYPVSIRKQVLETRYPDAIILPLADSQSSHEHWSAVLDETIKGINDGREVTLYGSRDSFIPKYYGEFKTEEIPAVSQHSATCVRDEVSGEFLNDPAFRRGWLSAIYSQYTVTDPTVDVAVHNSDFSQVLLGRRGKGSPLRFFGGFVDPEDDSYEMAARREREEEVTGIKTMGPEYIGSVKVDCPRYGGSKYGIMTTLFSMEYIKGDPVASDDMAGDHLSKGSVEWVDLDESLSSAIDKNHIPLLEMLLKYKALQMS